MRAPKRKDRPGVGNAAANGLAVLGTVVLAACDSGAAVTANPQAITFPSVRAPAVDQASVSVSARASSGLPIRYSSLTPAQCSIHAASGLVTGLRTGLCTVAADQAGNEHFAPATRVTQDIVFALTGQVLAFSQMPSLAVFDRGTVLAVDSTGAAVSYTSTTPLTCSVDSTRGGVAALAAGDCTVVASTETAQIAQTIAIAPASIATLPSEPTEIGASAGDTPARVVLHIGGTSAGGAALTGYTVISKPAGILANGPTSPIVVQCPSGCAGFAFSVSATNELGQGPASPFVDVVTSYAVVATFHEPDTQPNDTLFVGSFSLDATVGSVTELRGSLGESMTGDLTPYPNDTMTWLDLDHQLSLVPATIDGTRGLLVTTFRLPTTNTLSSAAAFGGTDGFSPGTGYGLYYGYPGENPGNAYARIFVNLSDPTATATQSQIDKLAYADCAPGGMMGATCMTGTTVAGYGTTGTMSGYPVSQTITRR